MAIEEGCIRIGQMAPDFTAQTTFGPVTLSDYRGQWVILFSHPGDFTPVCTTEFLAFTEAYNCFVAKNAQLLGLSIDSNASHLAWVYNIYQNTGVEVPFPIIADRDMRVARMYGMIAPDVNKSAAVRNVFIICPKGIVRAILIYPMTNGRNIDEICRLLTALQTSDEYGVATPANWMPGHPAVLPPPTTWAGLKERIDAGYDCMDWYLCYTELPKTE